jgi:hypothetical protein
LLTRWKQGLFLHLGNFAKSYLTSSFNVPMFGALKFEI